MGQGAVGAEADNGRETQALGAVFAEGFFQHPGHIFFCQSGRELGAQDVVDALVQSAGRLEGRQFHPVLDGAQFLHQTRGRVRGQPLAQLQVHLRTHGVGFDPQVANAEAFNELGDFSRRGAP